MTLKELGYDLKKTINFRYITADDYGVKLWWNKPHFNERIGVWSGAQDSWRGSVLSDALPDVEVNTNNSLNIERIFKE